MTRTKVWLAPAKVNLFLHIIGRDQSGYHRLQTLFQFVDICDHLSFKVTSKPELLRVRPLVGIKPEQDLCLRAAHLLREHSGCDLGVEIDLEKNIPMGGGLGGGSSNAATTLLALNQLWALGLSQQQLCDIGLQLGADVPVFVRGCAAWAEGIGEQLSPVELDQPWFLILNPGVSLATAEMYADANLQRDCRPVTFDDYLQGKCMNVFEPVARRRSEEITRALDWLATQAPARLSGSGACLFATFVHQQEAQQVQAALPSGWQAYLGRGCNVSPLMAQLVKD